MACPPVAVRHLPGNIIIYLVPFHLGQDIALPRPTVIVPVRRVSMINVTTQTTTHENSVRVYQ